MSLLVSDPNVVRPYLNSFRFLVRYELVTQLNSTVFCIKLCLNDTEMAYKHVHVCSSLNLF